MWIETIKVEGGSLDGFHQSLSPRLNVLIGGRGTGKSSVIELIRFCLRAPSSSDAAGKEALEHALGVLGDGKINITLTDGTERVEVSRIGTELSDNRPSDILPPFIFSQKEIEQIGAQAQSRLRLVDAFRSGRHTTNARRAPLHANIKSVTTEIRSLLAEIDVISQKLLALPKYKEKLAELQLQGAAQSTRSTELSLLRKSLHELQPRSDAAGSRVASTERSATKLSEWTANLALLIDRRPTIEPWPADAGFADQLASLRAGQEAASQRLSQVINEFRQLTSELIELKTRFQGEKLKVDGEARQIRQKIEEQQKGASILDRQMAEISQEISALTSLENLYQERIERVQRLQAQRQAALDEMHAQTQTLTDDRQRVAAELSKALAPLIRIEVRPFADDRAYLSVLNGALRGSGLHYRELSEHIVKTFSPIEIALLSERLNIDTISSALEITAERAYRVAQALRGDAGIDLLTAEVGDEIVIELLDGTSFKTTNFLSMGQRCTAILPIILQHTERVIVLDQPEDHLDNAFVVSTLVKAICARASPAQTIVATHNPNIPVLGDADKIIHLDSDGDRCFVLVSGALNDRSIVNSITTLMEGGLQAFQRRAKFYATSGADGT